MKNVIDLSDFLDEIRPVLRGVKGDNSSSGSPKPYSSIPKFRKEINKRVHAAYGKRQSVLRVISHVRGIRNARQLFEYVAGATKEGERMTLEADSGLMLRDSNEVSEYLGSWEADFSGRKNARDVMHMTVSVPQGSDRVSTLNAARNFGGEYLSNHEYVFVRHDDTLNPHVHFVVKVLGRDGVRLNMRKADLEEARETFTHHAQEQGIDVAASRRSWRGVGVKGETMAVRKLRCRGAVPYVDQSLRDDTLGGASSLGVAPWNTSIKAQRNKQLNEIVGMADELSRMNQNTIGEGGSVRDVVAALRRHASNFPAAKTRRELLVDYISGQAVPPQINR